MTATRTPSFETLRLEPVDDDLCWLVLDRPTVLNAMSVAMRREMLDALEHLAAGTWRVVLLRGEGRAFCSGADLKDFPQQVDVSDTTQVRAAVDGWHEVIRRLRDLPQASIAAIHGAVYGGGANLALAADIVIAGISTQMVQSYVDIGASVDLGGSWLLPRLAGLAQGRRLLLTGEPVDGARAVELGLVSEVVADDDLLTHAEEVGRVLATKDPTVLRMIRSTIDGGLHSSLIAHLDVEADGVAALLGGNAFRDATARFSDGS